MRRFATIALLGLVGCANNQTSERADFCAIDSLAQVEGVYTNRGSERLGGRNIFLSQILWLNEHGNSKLDHEGISEIEISKIKESYFASAVGDTSEKVELDFRLDSGSIRVFANTDVLPSPDGGVVVGPQSVTISLYKDCSGNLVLHKNESTMGLAFLLVPVWGEHDSYSTFSIVQQKANK